MWEAQNLPSIENKNEQAKGVVFEFMSYDYPEIKKIGSFLAASEYVSVKPSQESWENFNESLLNHKYLGKLLAKDNFLDKKVAPIISSANSSSDKVKQIINYIQSNFKWNGENKLFLSDNLDKIWKDKTGNSADLNSLFIYMLRKANIDAYAMVSATDDYNTDFTPSVKNFNYLQSLFKIDKDYYAYDIINVFRQGGNKGVFSIKNTCMGLADGDPKLIDLNRIKIWVQ
ncbi:MAG: transglutaminase-like domain-containing protein [Bacteroidales bacterium]